MVVDFGGGSRCTAPPHASSSSPGAGGRRGLRRRTTSTALAAGAGRQKLTGHEGVVPPGATLVGPAPAATDLPLTVTSSHVIRRVGGRSPRGGRSGVGAVPPFLVTHQIAQQFGRRRPPSRRSRPASDGVD